jgi:hypothetical protein
MPEYDMSMPITFNSQLLTLYTSAQMKLSLSKASEVSQPHQQTSSLVLLAPKTANSTG